MTSANAPQRLYIPRPFASGDPSATPSPVVAELTPIDTASGDTVNFVDGFPSVYSDPNGKTVTRGEMNAIGNLASVNEYYRRCGGINKFDPELAMRIGGYPMGAVLETLEGLDFHKVVSLVDDNKVDFSSTTLTQQQIAAGITLGSIDGANWAYCANGTINDSQFVADLPNFNWLKGGQSGAEIFTLCSFTAKKSGVISFEGSFEMESTSTESYSDTLTTVVNSEGSSIEHVTKTATAIQGQTYSSIASSGFMILCSSTPEQSPISSTTQVIFSRGDASITIGSVTFHNQNQHVMSVTKGQRYALYVLNQNSTVTKSTFKIKVVP